MIYNAENKIAKCPKFLVFNADNELDVAATLNNVPEVLDKTQSFFRNVPEWFAAGADVLEGYRELWEEINNIPAAELKKYTAEEIQKMYSAMQYFIECNEMMLTPGLNDNQKEVLRCICYWICLKTIAAFPEKP